MVDATTAEHARGIGTVIAGVLDGLAEMPDRALVAGGPSLVPPAGVEVRRVRLAKSRPGRVLYQRAYLPFDARRLSGLEGIDRILLLDAYAPMFRPSDGVRYAALVHDLLPLTHPQYWHPAKRVVKRLAYRSLRHNVTLFTSTAFNAELIERRFGREAHVIQFGCGQLSDGEADEALEAALPKREPYLVFVGAFEPRKNVLALIDIFERILDDGLDLRLVLAGDGSPLQVRLLQDRIASARNPDRFEIVRDTGRRPLLELLAHAYAMLTPTSAEGFGLPVLEALALGTPVISNDVPGIRSWAGDAISYASVENPTEWVAAVRLAGAMDESERRRRQAFTREFRWRVCAAKLSRF